jgi:uncharacterized repeat protein (TIGR01451 family)
MKASPSSNDPVIARGQRGGLRVLTFACVIAACTANDGPPASSGDAGTAFGAAPVDLAKPKDLVAPDRLATDNAGAIEALLADPDLALVIATLDDSLGSCDGDGVVDHGEYGKLTVTLRNTGTVPLTATSAVITALSPDVWFPTGQTLAFGSLPPGATASLSLRLAYVRTASGIQQIDLRIDYTATEIIAPLSQTVSYRTNTDEVPGSSAIDTVEPAAPPWTPAFNASLGNVVPWNRVEVDPLHHHWHVNDPDAGSDQYLLSPIMTVDGGGAVSVQFDHSWSFEFDGAGNNDGGVVEMSVNGGSFSDIGGTIGDGPYNGTIATYTGDANPLKGRPGFVQDSGGVVHTVLTRAVAPGSTIQLRFRAGSDGSIGAQGWDIDNVAFTGVVETPFATLVPDGHSCSIVPISADLAITVDDGTTTAIAGGNVTYAIVASNLGVDNIIGAHVADVFPGALTCTWTCAGSAGVSCASSGSGNIADVVNLPVAGLAIYTASCALPISTMATTLSNTAAIAPPGPVTDPMPGNNAATDVDTVIHAAAHLVGSKSVAGSFLEGDTVTYTIVLVNDGAGPQGDNPGDELTDLLPAGLTLVSANASTGTTVATLGTNTVTWNGALAAGSTVEITIVATINAAPGTRITNQATFSYDGDGNGSNDAAGVTDAFSCSSGAGLARRTRIAGTPRATPP